LRRVVGKSAAFDPIDFAARPWVPNTGYEALQPFVDRAAEVLNLSLKQPEPRFKTDSLRSFYWQFARSRRDHLDIMRFSSEFVTFDADNVRVLLNATATRIGLTADGGSFKDLEISTLEGVRSTVKARVAVIAASGVENPRLLLASKSVQACGIGNSYDRAAVPDGSSGRADRAVHSQLNGPDHQAVWFLCDEERRAHGHVHAWTCADLLDTEAGRAVEFGRLLYDGASA
jgi:hypothetical protein